MARLPENAIHVVALVLVALLDCAGPISALEEHGLVKTGYWPTGQSKAVAVSEGYVYYGKGLMLEIARVDSPESLAIVGEISARSPIVDVAVAGDHAYVATWGGGLRVIDVSAPSHPVEVGVVETYEELMAVDVSGDFLVIASRLDGLLAFDVSMPSSPVEVFSYDSSVRFFDVVMTLDYVYAVDCFDGLFIFGRSDPAVLRLVGRAEMEYCAGTVAVADGTAFLGTSSHGLRLLDVSSPWQPSEIGNLSGFGRIHGIDTTGTTAIVADTNGVHALDTSDPTTPIELGFFGTESVSWSVAVVGNHAFVGTGGGLRVIDVGDPANLDGIAGLVQPVDIRGLAAAESLIYAADGYHGLWVVDVSNHRTPTEIGFAEKRGQFPVSIVLEGNHAFMTDHTGLQILDVTDPTNPLTVGIFETPGFAFDVAVSSQVAYVADYGDSGGLWVVDVSDPSSPVGVEHLDTGSRTRRVVAADEMIYVGDDNLGLLVIDVSNPTTPRVRSRTPLVGLRVEDLAVVNGMAYVAQYRDAVQIIEVSDPDLPLVVGLVDWVHWPTGVAVEGDSLYLTEFEKGMHIVDISVPHAPVATGFIETQGTASAVEVLDDRVFMSDGDLGVWDFIRFPHRSEPTESNDWIE